MLERRKVYIEFTGRSSLLLVTPYVSRELQLKPEDDRGQIDLVTLKRCDDKTQSEMDFYACINVQTRDADDNFLSQPNYELDVFVRKSDTHLSRIISIAHSPADNKKKIEVSFPARD